MPRAAASSLRFLRPLALLLLVGAALNLSWPYAYARFPQLHFEAQRYVANNRTHFADAIRTRLELGYPMQQGLDVRPASAALCDAHILLNERCLPLKVHRRSAYDPAAFEALHALAANPCAYFGDAKEYYYLQCALPGSERPVVLLDVVEQP